MSKAESERKKMRPALSDDLAPASLSAPSNEEKVSDDGNLGLESAEPVAEQTELVDISTLIDLYHGPLYRYAYRLTGSQQDAEDLTQHAFLTAQSKLGQLKDKSKVQAWLYTVLRNSYLKVLRKKVPTNASAVELKIDEIPSRAEEHQYDFDSQLLQNALNDLGDEFRIVVVMFYFEEYSYKEIAEKLNLKIGTVMSRLSRAKGRIRQRLLATEVKKR